MFYKFIGMLAGLFLLAGCESSLIKAPVEELHWKKTTHVNLHQVKKGETLYAIAFRYDRDYRTLAIYNHLKAPYHVRTGQIIHLQPTVHKTVFKAPRVYKKPQRISYQKPSSHWLWPIKGKIIHAFNPNQGKKGIDIAGKKGMSIQAAASGVVAYSGAGLTGYGNLIIIKHDNQYLTAYGHNQRNRVKEGQKVKAGQIIADIGRMNAEVWGLHFEIRKMGVPVDPRKYLTMS